MRRWYGCLACLKSTETAQKTHRDWLKNIFSWKHVVSSSYFPKVIQQFCILVFSLKSFRIISCHKKNLRHTYWTVKTKMSLCILKSNRDIKCQVGAKKTSHIYQCQLPFFFTEKVGDTRCRMKFLWLENQQFMKIDVLEQGHSCIQFSVVN